VTLSVLLTAPLAWADAAPAGASAGPGGLMSFAPIVMIFVVFYFLLIRPQQKQAKEHHKMLDGVKRGDRVLTTGGLYGQVQAVRGKILDVKLDGDGVKVAVAKSGVATIVLPEGAAEAEVVAAKS
jgi:preprotein translocase subunit YajC